MAGLHNNKLFFRTMHRKHTEKEKTMSFNKRMLLFVAGLFFFVIVSGCDFLMSGSKIKGQVLDVVTGNPVPNVKIVASMSTDIQEDKKYESRQAISDGSGFFVVKGLSQKYEYTITATKQGFLSDKSRVRPPEKGQTKILQKPLEVALLPGNYGVFVFEKGAFKQINRLNFDRITRCAGCIMGRNSYYYTPKAMLSDIKKTQVGSGSVLIAYFPNYIRLVSIDPLYYFKKKAFTFEYNTPKDNVRTDVYVAKAVSDDLSILNTYALSTHSDQYKSPSGSTVGGVGVLQGRVPCKFKKQSNNVFMEIIKIHYLPRGIYALRDGDKGYPFQIE
jgi:hypothetical protein